MNIPDFKAHTRLMAAGYGQGKASSGWVMTGNIFWSKQ